MKFIRLRDNEKTRVNLATVVSYNEYTNLHSSYTKYSIIFKHMGGVAVTGESYNSKESYFSLAYNDVQVRDEDLKQLDTLLGL